MLIHLRSQATTEPKVWAEVSAIGEAGNVQKQPHCLPVCDI